MNRLSFIDRYHGLGTLEALLFVAVGALTIALALLLLRRRSRLRGMAIPLIAVALVQLAVGATVYLRSDAQIAQRPPQASAAPLGDQRDEAARRRTAVASFDLYRRIEIGLLALGMAIVVLLRNREFWFAFGLGLVLQAGLMLALDHFAEARLRSDLKSVLGR